ncbi:hypothetical protein R1flu_013887 [Riccia fluitans]|uniref:Uncharacterized protein n=1 Tax=Riccia fluitans TaxID=41844 RepID=A0ABD1YEJ1_9MARC
MNKSFEQRQVIGFWGVSGIGQTTLAKVIFNRERSKFYYTLFVGDVKTFSGTDKQFSLEFILVLEVDEHHCWERTVFTKIRRRTLLTTKMKNLLGISLVCLLLASTCRAGDPVPKPWPLQFHALMYMNSTGNAGEKEKAIVELWYDWVNGRTYNIIQSQLRQKLWDVEWNNGTSFYFDLDKKTCLRRTFPVGLLRPDFLNDAHYVGVRTLDTFTCNVWEKADFITYYEDVETQRPVGWLFFTGMFQHVIAFEEGAVLSDPYWQAPSYCFTDEAEDQGGSVEPGLKLPSKGQVPLRRWSEG